MTPTVTDYSKSVVEDLQMTLTVPRDSSPIRTTKRVHPTHIRDLLAFWNFQETPGSDRLSVGTDAFALREMKGPIQRESGGIFGPFCARIERGQWLRVPRSEIGALNICGQTPVSVVAWLQRESENPWQFIAGVWDERRARRQYGLFTSGTRKTDARTMTRTPARHQPHGYVSAEGGHTPGDEACFSYATGASQVPAGQWQTVAFSWDGHTIRVYVNGQLDELPHHNPFIRPCAIFDGGADGADFTVGQHDHPLWPDYPNESGPKDEGFGGLIGGLAVYRRALDSEEMNALSSWAKTN